MRRASRHPQYARSCRSTRHARFAALCHITACTIMPTSGPSRPRSVLLIRCTQAACPRRKCRGGHRDVITDIRISPAAPPPTSTAVASRPTLAMLRGEGASSPHGVHATRRHELGTGRTSTSGPESSTSWAARRQARARSRTPSQRRVRLTSQLCIVFGRYAFERNLPVVGGIRHLHTGPSGTLGASPQSAEQVGRCEMARRREHAGTYGATY